MKEIKVTNQIPNPDFTPSLGGWAGGGGYNTAHVLYGAHALKLSGSVGVAEVTASTTATLTLINSHIYYARVYSYQEVAQGTLDIYWPIAEPSFTRGVTPGVAGKWNLHSVLGKRSSFASGLYQLRLDYNNGSVTGDMWFDGVMLIDLTEAFGAGDEPSQQWCDENIQFTIGTAVLPYWISDVPVFEDASVVPNEAITGAAVTISTKLKIAGKLFTAEYPYSGEITSGEV